MKKKQTNQKSKKKPKQKTKTTKKIRDVSFNVECDIRANIFLFGQGRNEGKGVGPGKIRVFSKKSVDFKVASIKLLGKGRSLLREGRRASEQNLTPLNKVRVLPLLSVKLKFTCTVKPSLCGLCGRWSGQGG